MRLLFFGSGEFGLPTLAWLCARHNVAAVISQPDRPAGRRRQLRSTPVAAWAQDHGLVVRKTDNVNDPAFIHQLEMLEPGAAVIVAFGQKLSPKLVGSLGEPAVNLHGSLLPKYRGAAPINWAMMRGETITGVTVIGIAQKMDAGPMYARASLMIDPQETAGQLHDRLAALGPQVIEQVLGCFDRGELRGEVQDERAATLAPKLGKADGTVDFAQPCELVRARIHGLTPWPGCRVRWRCQATGKESVLTLRKVTTAADLPCFGGREGAERGPVFGQVMDDFLVATGAGAVRLAEVQPAGKKPMSIDDFAHGHQLAAGDRLDPIGIAASR